MVIWLKDDTDTEEEEDIVITHSDEELLADYENDLMTRHAKPYKHTGGYYQDSWKEWKQRDKKKEAAKQKRKERKRKNREHQWGQKQKCKRKNQCKHQKEQKQKEQKHDENHQKNQEKDEKRDLNKHTVVVMVVGPETEKNQLMEKIKTPIVVPTPPHMIMKKNQLATACSKAKPRPKPSSKPSSMYKKWKCP